MALPGMDACVAPTAYYGDVAGSSPDWVKAQFVDRGRVHLKQQAEFGSVGFEGWTAVEQTSQPQRRMFVAPPTRAYAEPAVQGGNASYLARRSAPEDAGGAYRRTLRALPDPATLRAERTEGKRAIAEPFGPGPTAAPGCGGGLARGAFAERRDARAEAPQPAMPRLGRPVGICGLRESDAELSYERAMGRKVRVAPDDFTGTGRAGDMSGLFGAPRRPEDDATFFKSLKDTPTFIRFCSTLPPPATVSPHTRREQEQRRNAESEKQRDRELVAALDLPDADEQAAA